MQTNRNAFEINLFLLQELALIRFVIVNKSALFPPTPPSNTNKRKCVREEKGVEIILTSYFARVESRREFKSVF